MADQAMADRTMAYRTIEVRKCTPQIGAEIRQKGLKRPGLMATAFTTEERFYTDRLREAGLEPLVPEAADRAVTHRIIYEELCQGIVLESSREAYVEIAERLFDAGADSLILGCTEVGMLLSDDNVSVPVFDTTLIHCAAALNASLKVARQAAATA